MTPSNTLTPAKNAITYTVGGHEITLNAGIIKRYLVSGDADQVTDQEVLLFAKLCQHQGLNPFLKDAYLVKYRNSPAQTIVSKGALEKRAYRCKDYRGFEAGIIVRHADGTIEQRPGTFYAEDEQLVGEVHRAAGGLLAVAERGVEDLDASGFGIHGRLPVRKLAGWKGVSLFCIRHPAPGAPDGAFGAAGGRAGGRARRALFHLATARRKKPRRRSAARGG